MIHKNRTLPIIAASGLKTRFTSKRVESKSFDQCKFKLQMTKSNVSSLNGKGCPSSYDSSLKNAIAPRAFRSVSCGIFKSKSVIINRESCTVHLEALWPH